MALGCRLSASRVEWSEVQWNVESERAERHPSQKVFITGLLFVFCANAG